MVDDAKRAGCEVGITTNGDLLEPAIDWIVEKNTDQIVLSVAGDAAAHADLRSGAQLDQLWTVLGRLVARRGGKKLPKVKVSYLLTRRNCSQVSAIVEAAAEAGADELFVIHLDCTPTRELLDESVFTDAESISEAAEALGQAAAVARKHRIGFRAPRLAPLDLLVCSLDPPSIVFVRADGRVGPCVYLGLPVSGSLPRCSREAATEVEATVYGDLAQERLAEILDGERFRTFTGEFDERLAIERRFVDGVAERSALENLSYLDEADRRREQELEAHPFPADCAGCHKVVGW
jgi:MoaA/NifB/PqqE/SkfB family radical SAM enzyme